MSKQACDEIKYPSFNEPYSVNLKLNRFRQSSFSPKLLKNIKRKENSESKVLNHGISWRSKFSKANHHEILNGNRVQAIGSLSPTSFKLFYSTNPPDTWKNRIYQSNSLRQKQSTLIFNKIIREDNIGRNLNNTSFQSGLFSGNRSVTNIDNYSLKKNLISEKDRIENLITKKIYLKSFEHFTRLHNILPEEKLSQKKLIPYKVKFEKLKGIEKVDKKFQLNNELKSAIKNKPLLNNNSVALKNA